MESNAVQSLTVCPKRVDDIAGALFAVGCHVGLWQLKAGVGAKGDDGDLVGVVEHLANSLSWTVRHNWKLQVCSTSIMTFEECLARSNRENTTFHSVVRATA